MVRGLTEILICFAVMCVFAYISVQLDDQRVLVAGPIAAVVVSLIFKLGGPALEDRRKMISLIGMLVLLGLLSAIVFHADLFGPPRPW